MKNVANIINFARGCEPRSEDDSFLLPTLREELELCKRFGFRSTVLLQYDALATPDYPALVKSGYDVEVGLWLEVVQPLTYSPLLKSDASTSCPPIRLMSASP